MNTKADKNLKIVRVQSRIKSNMHVTIPLKIAKRQCIRAGTFMTVTEDPCGGIIFRKLDT